MNTGTGWSIRWGIRWTFGWKMKFYMPLFWYAWLIQLASIVRQSISGKDQNHIVPWSINPCQWDLKLYTAIPHLINHYVRASNHTCILHGHSLWHYWECMTCRSVAVSLSTQYPHTHSVQDQTRQDLIKHTGTWFTIIRNILVLQKLSVTI